MSQPAQRPPVIKRGFQERSRSAGLQLGAHNKGEKGQRCDITPDIHCVIMKYSVLRVCVCVNRSAHGQNVFPGVALCKLAVSQTYPCLHSIIHTHTRTLPRGNIRGLTGVDSSVARLVLLCCVRPWASPPPSREARVSSSHTATLTQQRKPGDPEHWLPLCYPFVFIPNQTLPWKTSLSSSTSFFRCEAACRAGLCRTHKLAR